MIITRRDFFKYCTVSAAAWDSTDPAFERLEAALAGDGVPTLIWLHGSGLSGRLGFFFEPPRQPGSCRLMSLPAVFCLNTVNLAYHTVLMSSAGETAVTMASQAKRKGGYVLVCEGAVPTIYNGHACNILTINGQEKTYQDMLLELAPGAAASCLCRDMCLLWRDSKSN